MSTSTKVIQNLKSQKTKESLSIEGFIEKPSYKRSQPILKNPNRICTICNFDYKAVSPLQKTCSYECRVEKNRISKSKFDYKHPEKQKEYSKNRIVKNPSIWKEKYRSERNEIISVLGGKCVACGHNKIIHLHIDYAPTMIGTGFRHPRHKKWVLDNIKDFRLLCANHHYELTTTGKIENTSITQITQFDE